MTLGNICGDERGTYNQHLVFSVTKIFERNVLKRKKAHANEVGEFDTRREDNVSIRATARSVW